MAPELPSRWLEGKTAVILEAASPIGQAFALALARRGTHLRLVTNAPDALRPLAVRLSRENAVQVDVVGTARTRDGAEQQDIWGDILLLPGEAAFFHPEPAQSQNSQQEMGASELLAPAALAKMVTPGQVVLMQVASLAAAQPLPLLNAPTARLLSSRPACWAASDCCLVQVLGLRASRWSGGWLALPDWYAVALLTPGAAPKRVATTAIRVVERGRSTVVPGLAKALLVRCLYRFLPLDTVVQ
jgi:hypothetical protein